MRALVTALCLIIVLGVVTKVHHPDRPFFQSWESPYPEVRSGIIHDYQIKQAQQACDSHDSELHYVVPEMTVYSEFREGEPRDESGSYPCSERLVVSCQDGNKYAIQGEVKYCFISVSQMEEARATK